MKIPKFVLDSTVIINHINKQLDIEVFFDTLPAFDRYISDITNIEALSKPSLKQACLPRISINRRLLSPSPITFLSLLSLINYPPANSTPLSGDAKTESVTCIMPLFPLYWFIGGAV
jgi:hypothetical protein